MKLFGKWNQDGASKNEATSQTAARRTVSTARSEPSSSCKEAMTWFRSSSYDWSEIPTRDAA